VLIYRHIQTHKTIQIRIFRVILSYLE